MSDLDHIRNIITNCYKNGTQDRQEIFYLGGLRTIIERESEKRLESFTERVKSDWEERGLTNFAGAGEQYTTSMALDDALEAERKKTQ